MILKGFFIMRDILTLYEYDDLILEAFYETTAYSNGFGLSGSLESDCTFAESRYEWRMPVQ